MINGEGQEEEINGSCCDYIVPTRRRECCIQDARIPKTK